VVIADGVRLRLWQADDPGKLAAAVRALVHEEGLG
jgi:hypothetical protein